MCIKAAFGVRALASPEEDECTMMFGLLEVYTRWGAVAMAASPNFCVAKDPDCWMPWYESDACHLRMKFCRIAHVYPTRMACIIGPTLPILAIVKPRF